MEKWWMMLVVMAIGANVLAADEQAKETVDAKEAAVMKLTKDNFDKTLKDNSVVLVDFWAPWCGPCRVQGPILDEVARDMGSNAMIGKVNVDENKELASKYDVKSIPTLIVFKDGEIRQTLVGVHQKQDIVKIINEAK